MNIAWKAAAVLFVALFVAACGGGGEEGAIKDLMEDFFDRFEDGDAEKLAGLFSSECGDMAETATEAIEELQTFGERIDFILVRVDVRNLEEDSAEVLPEGFVYIDRQQSPLTGEDEEYAPVVKEDGEWKLADCELFQ